MTRSRRARRVVVKVGSSSLTTAEGGIDPQRIEPPGRRTGAGTAVRARGCPGLLRRHRSRPRTARPRTPAARPRHPAGGRLGRSGAADGPLHRSRSARTGCGVGQVLLTADDVTRRAHYRNAYRTFGRLLELGVVPIVNENDTVATARDPVRRQRPAGRRWWRISCTPTRWCCSATLSALYTGEPSQRPRRARSTTCAGEADLAGIDIRLPAGPPSAPAA